MNALTVYLGMAPQPLDDLLRGPQTIPVPPADVVVGIPADLVRRRPDIRAAELAAMAAKRADRHDRGRPLPGVQPVRHLWHRLRQSRSRNKLSDVFMGKGITFGFGPTFTWNILNYGQITNQVRVQDAKLQELLVDYQNSVLTAQQQVEDGLATFPAIAQGGRRFAAPASPPPTRRWGSPFCNISWVRAISRRC